MNLLLRALPGDPEHSEFGWFALVIFKDNKNLESIAKYRKKFLELQQRTDDFSDLEELRFSAGNVLFYASDATYTEKLPELGPRAARSASLESLLHENDDEVQYKWIEDTVVLSDEEFCDTDIDTLVLDERGVTWMACSADTDDTSITATVPYGFLFKDRL